MFRLKTLRWRRELKCETLGEGRSYQICKSETPKGPKATQVPGRTRTPAAPAGPGRERASRWGPAALRSPLPPAPHSAHSSARCGSWPPLDPREAFRTPAIKGPPLSLPAPLAPSLLPFLSGPAHPRGREMGREARRKPLPTAPSKKHDRTARSRGAGLAPVNSGGLCSRQLFPGHLTCQLLGKCC